MDERHDSQRILRFSNNLDSLTETMASTKKQTVIRYENTLASLQEKFAEMENTRRSGTIEEHLRAITATFSETKLENETSVAMFTQTTRQLDSRLRQTLNSMGKERDDGRCRMEKALDGRIGLVEDTRRKFSPAQSFTNKTLLTDLDRLAKECEALVSGGRRADHAFEETIARDIAELRAGMKRSLAVAQRRRDEMRSKFEAVVAGLDEAMAREASDRRESEHTLCGLVESACYRVSRAKALS
ncbi:hypothetical protein J8273_5881 [Carpediemonas membranifera]|uniref:SF-assemblin n=1 Tax=Carpediemonas membranifera TaxID=201153 RepID=A0A8J6B9G3_9EUKA|nr:hypothetical protein J8273_5881 [Carpediemonas membranifera]|eukprot:KAG9392742.1 hypothetical protein J8273_5881 [Carpediemonas membranifera]